MAKIIELLLADDHYQYHFEACLIADDCALKQGKSFLSAKS